MTAERGALKPWNSPDAEPDYRGRNEPYLRAERFDDVRARLEEDLGEPVWTRAWDHLARVWPEGLVRLRREPAAGLAILRQKYEISCEDMRPRRDQHARTAQLPDDPRDMALARLLAARIERRPELSPLMHEFRRQVLAGELLAPTQIPVWVEAQAQREGQPSQAVAYLPVPVLNGGSQAWEDLLFERPSRKYFANWLRDLAAVVESCAEVDLQMPQLAASEEVVLRYGAPGGSVSSHPIRYDGTLAALKDAVSGVLGVCKLTGWQEHEGVAFVLSGWIPPRPRLALTADPYATLLLARGRISIDVDPRVSPRRLEAAYARLRAGHATGAERTMRAEHLELAVFTERTLDEGLTWPQRRQRWNREHRGWRYPVAADPLAKRFALESRRAWERLTGESWPWRRVGREESFATHH